MTNKIYNSYAIGFAISIFCLICGMEFQTYLTVKNTPVFAAIFPNPTQIENTLLITSNSLGAIFGSIICGQICPRFGYIRVFQTIVVIWIIGNFLGFFSITIWLLIIARIVKGIAIGFTYACVPIYIHEIIPPNTSGRILSITIFASALGNLVTFVIYNAIEQFVKETTPIWTRLYWSFEIIPVLISLGFTFILPESPKWLATISEWSTAADVLQSIQLKNSGNLNKETRTKLGDKHFVIKEYTSGICIKSCSLQNLFGKKYIRELITSLLVQFFLVFTFITKLHETFDCICYACQLGTNDIKLGNLFELLMRVLLSSFPFVMLDILRRKDTIIFGMLITIFIMMGYSVIFTFFSFPAPHTASYWHLQIIIFDNKASLILAITFYSQVIYTSILLPSSWLLVLETFSSSSRIQGWIVSTSIFWILETITSLIFPFLLQLFNEWLFLIITIICIIGFGASFKLEETKGKFILDAEYLVLDSKSLLQLSPSKNTFRKEPIEKVEGNKYINTIEKVEGNKYLNTIHRFGSKNASLGSKRNPESNKSNK